MRSLGWLISVQTPSVDRRPLYTTIANTHEHAKAVVGAYCAATVVTQSGSKGF